ncbi:MAG TPA: ABC transporter permease, partial [Anaerolineales bacterium]
MNVSDFLRQYGGELAREFAVHLQLMGWSLGLALLLSAPLAVAMLRWQVLVPPVLAVVSIMQTVPSIALLGFLLPWLGIGTKPAVAALVLYALLPLVRNSYVGLSGTDPLVVDAARGMGMSWGQILRQVRLPLALPVVFAGIRTAAVINVGVTTLSALVGAGGLGVFIFRGIATNNTAVILLGALPAALLAVTIDGLLAWMQQLLLRRRRHGLLVAAGLVLFLSA